MGLIRTACVCACCCFYAQVLVSKGFFLKLSHCSFVQHLGHVNNFIVIFCTTRSLSKCPEIPNGMHGSEKFYGIDDVKVWLSAVASFSSIRNQVHSKVHSEQDFSGEVEQEMISLEQRNSEREKADKGTFALQQLPKWQMLCESRLEEPSRSGKLKYSSSFYQTYNNWQSNLTIRILVSIYSL